MQTIHEFITSAGISMTAKPVDHNPDMNSDPKYPMDHWKCTLKAGHSQMTVTFSMGIGHKGKAPEAAEVLSCVASDSTSADQSFEDWCVELGYDTDSRKAERTYNLIKRQAAKLRNFLGESAYQTLMHSVEHF